MLKADPPARVISPLFMPKRYSRNCESGHHSPSAAREIRADGVAHAICRYCGCDLMRTASARRWFRCGVMGD